MRPAFDADYVPRVLIVDDERHNRELLGVMLAAEGYLLVDADSGEAALASIAERPPDLILLDVMMPGIDGYGVVESVKSNAATKNIPIILVTALDDRSSKIRGLSAGAEDFLSKPVDRVELCVRVKNLLRLKAYGDSYDRYSRLLEGEIGSRTADLLESEHLSESALRLERDRAQRSGEALRITEERMRFALETADVGIWDMDFATGTLQWSETLEAQYGLKPGTFGGTFEAFIERIHPEDRVAVRETIAIGAKSGADFSLQNRSIWPDGSVQWLTCVGRIVLDEHGEPLHGVGVSQNITERRTLERQFQQAQKMDAIGRLASGVAHDFNNLLTVIIGFAGFVSADATLEKGHARDLEEITKAAQRAAGLTRQLLAFSRQQVLKMAPVDINGLITDMTGMFERLIGEHIDVRAVLAPGLPVVLADQSQLEQVVMNLVVNARDAMPEGGMLTIESADVELENASFREEAIKQGRYVMLAISDTGTGMTVETQRRLFEPFYTTKEAGKGTGLGLSTCYGIVKQSNGYIWVYSEPNRGTTFKVYLPCASAESAVHGVNPLIPMPVARPVSETVLLVEDEPGVRKLSERILVKAGYRVLEAANGNDAEKLFAEHADSIDLLVTDVIMPGCGGPELLNRLQVHAPALRVLYMSGFTEQSAAHHAGIDRGLPFVQKPFTAAELVRQVRGALDR